MPSGCEWVNWKQAVKILGCSKSHFYNLVNSGKIRSRRVGRVKGLKALRADCEKWVQSGEHPRED